MDDMEERRPKDLKPALVLHENGQVSICFPKGDDDEALCPKHVEFIAALMILLSDREFLEYYAKRADEVIRNAEESNRESEPVRHQEDVREVMALSKDEIGDWGIGPADAGIVLTSDWTLHVYFPDCDELGDEDPIPDHIVRATILALLINTDPEFVEKVWELWEEKHRELGNEE